ncbi:hypothetical protein GEMRC1_001984 [Eukaryota sp. GEM-RC1]
MSLNPSGILPLLNRVLVRKLNFQDIFPSKISVPSSASMLHVGEVCRIAEDVKSVSVGDRVVLPQFGGLSFPLEHNSNYIILDADEIQAKLE